jgi:lipoate-protein ligase A
MKYLDQTLPSPAANLACDEVLLDSCDAGGTEVLRFWESKEIFVVVGFSNAVATEVKSEACRQAGVAIFRRCSGGGTVLQGPGCLNYALALNLQRPGLETIPAANHYIMEKHRAALAALLRRPVEIRGHTDLTLGGVKFSGNAQRRRRHALLFHGTFLLDFDLGLMESFLAIPSRQPEYRARRSHDVFLTNLRVAAAAVKRALAETWAADAPLAVAPDCQKLIAEKYSRNEWNLKF